MLIIASRLCVYRLIVPLPISDWTFLARAYAMAINMAEGMGLNIGRHAMQLPYHQDNSERIILGILALYEELSQLTTLEPDEQDGRLFNQLFDLVTMSKTTAAMDNTVRLSWRDSRKVLWLMMCGDRS